MKRRAFILTEILTGMALQSIFALTLCGAFYMLLSFSTSTQQILAAHDEGQSVISYVEARIRNAGIGMWAFKNPEELAAKAFSNISAIKNLALPVAISTVGNIDKSVREDGIYKGNVLTLLYAHKDNNEYSYQGTKKQKVRLIVITDDMTMKSVSALSASGSKNDFDLLDAGNEGATEFASSGFNTNGIDKDIKCYAVMESSGKPVFLNTRRSGSNTKSLRIGAPKNSGYSVDIYPMSELLNLECERMYVNNSTGESSLMLESLGSDSKWDAPKPHVKGILEIYMELDTNPDIPIFTMSVLVCEGKSDSETYKPKDWPGRWDDEFSKHKLHVSRASWKLYNLAQLFR